MGKYWLGGEFTTFNGGIANHIIRLNTNGTLDTSFKTTIDEKIIAIAIQSDRKILVGGGRIYRVNIDGTKDTSFNTTIGSAMNAIAIQSDGKILVGGGLKVYRININGTTDTSFIDIGTGFDNVVNAIALQPDGKIWVGGYFEQCNGYNSKSLIRLFLQDKIAITGPGGPSTGADWGVDYFLTDAGGGIWTANNIVLPGGPLKFRLNGTWITNWGATRWPTGIGTQDGPNIPGIAGTYNVIFNQNTGEYSFSKSLSIDAQVVNDKIGVFPNPTRSVLNLSVNDSIILNKVTIVDITGKIVLEQTKNLSTINVEQLAKGVYVLNAYAGDKKYQEKFIKE